MRFNIFWLAPLVLPFVFLAMIFAILWVADVATINRTRGLIATLSIVFGAAGGGVAAWHAMAEGIGWLSFPSKKGEGE